LTHTKYVINHTPLENDLLNINNNEGGTKPNVCSLFWYDDVWLQFILKYLLTVSKSTIVSLTMQHLYQGKSAWLVLSVQFRRGDWGEC
jgi:hypothetical protein